MKKSVLLLATLMFLVTFTSCFKDKEGEYKPKEKISRIFKDYGDGKQLREVWNWDKKQLKSIDHYYGGDLEYTEEFTYNKKDQIERVDIYTDGVSVEYTYDGSKITKATAYEDGAMACEYAFKHDGKQITDIEVMWFYDKKGNSNRIIEKSLNPLKVLLPEKSYKAVQKVMMNAASSKESYSIKLTWDKNNVSKLELTEGSYRCTYEYRYDDKLNPFANLFSMFSVVDNVEYGDGTFTNKNNVVEIRETETSDGETETDTYKYSYSYDGKFPTVQRYTYTSTYTIGGYWDYVWNEETYEYEEIWIPEETYTETYTTSTYYEYL